MQKHNDPEVTSAFNALGYKKAIKELIKNISELYVSFSAPWIIGYSGGKDSTAVLQLVWMSLETLSPEQRKHPVHVINTDTLVENPVVAFWVTNQLEKMRTSAATSRITNTNTPPNS